MTRVELPSCGRLLVGQGNDTYDPNCVLKPAHGGRCMSKEALERDLRDHEAMVEQRKQELIYARRLDMHVGVNAWGWHPWGLSFAGGMAIHNISSGRPFDRYTERDQAAKERRLPNNQFVQHAREADRLLSFHVWSHHLMCHDRPEGLARMAGAYGRAEGSIVQPHAMWAMTGVQGRADNYERDNGNPRLKL